jgi:regulator of sirC expression with transglutaminase-like and TPR domain
MSRLILTIPLFALLLGTARSQEPEEGAEKFSVEQLVQQIRPSLVTIRTQGRDGNERGIGTGFVVGSGQLVATNLHVIGEGRPFTMELSDRRRLEVLAVEASDHALDLAVIRVQADPDRPLQALKLSTERVRQGMPVVAMGNPWGLRESVVNGVVSAFRTIDDREMIQLAIPIEPGNSGGPVVNQQGQVVGIVNMKSALEQNIGFAIQTPALRTLLDKPNPVAIERWTTIGTLDLANWKPLFGADWRQRGGRILVSGTGQGFGGRSLCLAEEAPPTETFELAVSVKLDDEAGAAGLVFHSDGSNEHYGFYPSNGNLRLSCFRGPTVYSWQVLEEQSTEHYRNGEWNRLKVRIEQDRLLCFVNGQLVIESKDRTYLTGKVGLAKFRQTEAEFKHFRLAGELPDRQVSDEIRKQIETQLAAWTDLADVAPEQLHAMGKEPATSQRILIDQARQVERQAKHLAARAEQLRQLSDDLHVRDVAAKIAKLIEQEPIDLLRGALLIAQLEEPDLSIETYMDHVERMATEIRQKLVDDADDGKRLRALNEYLFEEHGFHGSRVEYYHRANSMLNRVIDDREGLPISLSVLFMELGQRVNVKIEGVGLPGHFVVRFIPSDGDPQLIDVFDRGKHLTREAAEKLVRNYTDGAFTDDMLKPTEPSEILTRMLRNLLGVAEREADREAMHRYLEVLVALDPETFQYRGLRAVVRSETGRRAAAIADLDWILDEAPAGLDLEQIRQMREVFERR